jgi:hypothetical protein
MIVRPLEAPAVAAAQRTALNLEIGATAELARFYDSFKSCIEPIPALRCGLALTLAAAGQQEAAQAHYDALAEDGFAVLKRGRYRLLNLSALAILANELGDGRRAPCCTRCCFLRTACWC